MASEMAGSAEAEPEPPEEISTKLDCLRQWRRNQRSEFYAEILQLQEASLSPGRSPPRIGMNVRTVERWLTAGGEPEHRRPPSRSGARVDCFPVRTACPEQEAGRRLH